MSVRITKLFIGPALALSMAACSANSADIVKQITAVQQATVKACSYLPTATVIAAIFTKNQADLKSVEQVAAAICSVASGAKSTLVTMSPSVAGVPLDGFFVEKVK